MYVQKIKLGALALTAVAIVYIALQMIPLAFGNVTVSTPTQDTQRVLYTFFATSTNQTNFATTTTAVSTNIDPWFDEQGQLDRGYFVISGAKDVTLFFGRGDTTGQGNTGSTEYTVQVSQDGSTWYDYTRMQPASTTLATADARFTTVSSAGIVAATTTDVFKMVDLGWYAVRCTVTETTDGEHSCSASAEF